MNRSKLSRWPVFNAKRYEQGSRMWQMCIVLENMEDPRFIRGSELLILLLYLPCIVMVIVGAVVWIPPHNNPAPQEDVNHVG